MLDYEQRDANLKKIGFDKYADYLASPLWSRIRKKVLDRNDGQCLVCGCDAVEIHHTSYIIEVLLGWDIEKLLPLCRTCHQLAEFSTDGRKRDLSGANECIGYLRSLDAPGEKVACLPPYSGRREHRSVAHPGHSIPRASPIAEYEPATLPKRDQFDAEAFVADLRAKREGWYRRKQAFHFKTAPRYRLKRGPL